MLDSDLAVLYGVETKQLTRQVRRNINRFPDDFMFRLTKEDFLRCQIGTSKSGGRRYPPYAFTEHGILMLSSVLNSERAIQVNIQIMRTFTKLRELMLSHRDLQKKIKSMESKYDYQFKIVFDAIKQLLESPDPPHNTSDKKPKKRIGYR